MGSTATYPAAVALAVALLLGGSTDAPSAETAPPAPSADERIEAEGIATVAGGDVAAARDRALDDALRKAVEQAVGTLIETETRVRNYEVLNDSIYAQSRGFVRSYRILSEKHEDPLYRVTVEAAVAVGDLRSDLQALGLLIQRMRKPRVMVMIAEENVLDHGWWRRWTADLGMVETALIGALRAREFTVMDSVSVRQSIDRESAMRAIQGDAEAGQLIARRIGAEVLITGQAVAEPAGTVAGSNMTSYQASATARAVKADSGEILGASSGSGKAAHLNATAGGAEALKQAGAMMADDLISQITAQWAGEASGARMVGLSVSGVTRRTLDELVARMKGDVRGVVDVFQREYAGSVARLDVDYEGGAETLARSLEGLVLEGGTLTVTGTTPNKVDARILPSGP